MTFAGWLVAWSSTIIRSSDFRADDVDFLEQLFQHSVEVPPAAAGRSRSCGPGWHPHRVFGWCCLVSPSPDLGAFATRSQGQPRWLGAATGRHCCRQFPGNRQAAGRTAWVPPSEGRNGTSKATSTTTESITQQGVASEKLARSRKEEPGERQRSGQQQPTTSKAERAARLRHARNVLEHRASLLRLPNWRAESTSRGAQGTRVHHGPGSDRHEDGGWRLSSCSQPPLSTTCDNQVVVGVDVETSGSDRSCRGCWTRLKNVSNDRKRPWWTEDILIGLRTSRSSSKERRVRKYIPPCRRQGRRGRLLCSETKDSPPGEWRQRMGTEEAKEIYKQRGATAEWVNPQARNQWSAAVVEPVARIKSEPLAYGWPMASNMARDFFLQSQPVVPPHCRRLGHELNNLGFFHSLWRSSKVIPERTSKISRTFSPHNILFITALTSHLLRLPPRPNSFFACAVHPCFGARASALGRRRPQERTKQRNHMPIHQFARFTQGPGVRLRARPGQDRLSRIRARRAL